MWSIAIWQEEKQEEEGVIPTVWIEKKTVRWPTGLHAKKAFANLQVPLKDWDSFPLIKVRCSSG